MEENRRFRNHVSVVAERVGAGTYALLAVLAGIFIQNADELLDVGGSPAGGQESPAGAFYLSRASGCQRWEGYVDLVKDVDIHPGPGHCH